MESRSVSERALMAAARADRAQVIVSALRGLIALSESVDGEATTALLAALDVAARVARKVAV